MANQNHESVTLQEIAATDFSAYIENPKDLIKTNQQASFQLAANMAVILGGKSRDELLASVTPQDVQDGGWVDDAAGYLTSELERAQALCDLLRAGAFRLLTVAAYRQENA